jgi:seryl-tRNA synthetase
VPDDVPVDDNEDNNLVVDTYGAFEREDWMLSHYDLTTMAGLANTEKGSKVAGSRGYYLLGAGMRLNQALIAYVRLVLVLVL